AGLIGILLLWRRSDVSSTNGEPSPRGILKYVNFDNRINTFNIFAATFILALLSTPIYIGITLLWKEIHKESFLLEIIPVYLIYFPSVFYVGGPISVALFPSGLDAYLPDTVSYSYISLGWGIYIGTPILAILVKQKWFSTLLFIFFIIVLIVNIAGC